MIYFRPGSQIHLLTAVLAVTGEIPLSGLSAFGSQRTVRALVARLVEPQTLHNTVTGEELTCRLLKLHGKGAGKTIRFYKGGLPVLDWLGVREYYLASFWNHNFPSDPQHSNRMERVSETVLALMQAGVEYRVWRLPALSILERQELFFPTPAYFLARDLKKVGVSETNKIQFSRITGAIFTADSVIPVYNTQDAVMKWNGEGEFKTKLSLLDLTRKNTRIREINSAILFGKSFDTAVRIIETTEKNVAWSSALTGFMKKSILFLCARLVLTSFAFFYLQTGMSDCFRPCSIWQNARTIVGILSMMQ